MWLHAVQIYQKLVHDAPEAWKYRVRLGMIYLEMGNLVAAEQVLLQALRLDPHNADVLYTLGMASYQSNELDRALFYLRELAGKDIAKVHYLIGLVYWKRLDYVSAERHFRIAFDLEDGNVDTALALGEACLRNGNFADAVEVLGRAVTLAPTDNVVSYVYAQALIHTEAFDEAEIVLRGLITRAAEPSDAMHALAGVLMRLRRYDDAEQLLKSMLTQESDQARILIMLGRLALVRAQREKAEEYFRRVLEIDPQHQEALEQLRYFIPHVHPSS